MSFTQWTGAQSARHVLNGTARIATAAHTEIVSGTNPESFSNAKSGDVLVSHPVAVHEHETARIEHVLERLRGGRARHGVTS